MPIHFITGLPRSGTTLLGAILRQNPRFSGGMSSPLHTLVMKTITALSPASNEFAAGIDDERRKQILRYTIDAWMAGFPGKDVVFDTNRGWTSNLELIADLLPDTKIIAMVRNPAWILDSFERIHRSSPYTHSKILTSGDELANVYSRAEALGRPERVIGASLLATKEAFYSPHSSRMLVIDYDFLAKLPDQVMKLVYQFIDEPFFQHDFDDVEYSAPEFDALLSAPGLHDVKRKVGIDARTSVLPPDLFESFSKRIFWDDPSRTKAKVIVAT